MDADFDRLSDDLERLSGAVAAIGGILAFHVRNGKS